MHGQTAVSSIVTGAATRYLFEDAAGTDDSTLTYASWWASLCWKAIARVELCRVGKVRCRLGIVFPNGIDSVDGADLHDVSVGP
jgi:hypothetical protein